MESLQDDRRIGAAHDNGPSVHQIIEEFLVIDCVGAKFIAEELCK
jgi:hypothetical protein